LKNILYDLLNESGKLETREELYDLILDKAILALSNANKGSILKVIDNQVFSFEAAKGFDMKMLKKISLKLEETYLYKETKGKVDRTVIINNSSEYNRESVLEENQLLLSLIGMKDIQTTISTPIIVNGKLWGMINADSIKKDAFSAEDVKSIELFASEVEKVIKLYDSLEENQYLLKYDTLTQVFNRRYFNELIEKIMGDITPMDFFTLVSIDLDNLKRINDRYGHEQGDNLLIRFSEGVKNHLHKEDIFARYGGDEFLILLKSKHIHDAERIMYEVNLDFSETYLNINGQKEKISFSYGIVEFPIDGEEGHNLMKIADEKMYTYKRLKKANDYLNHIGDLDNE
jgi:diguanylate cyclase (GGDEF)-like protein